jgi:septal ring factor EnvC (AmiA/AmiB activator)
LIRGWAAAAAFAAAGALAAPLASGAEADDLKALRERLQTLRGELAATEGRREGAADALKDSEEAISEASRALAELTGASRAAQAQQSKLGEESRRLQTELDARSADLGRLLHARYVTGDAGALRVLLSGDEASRTARQLAYFGYLSRAQLALIDGLRRDMDRLADLGREAQQKSAEITALAEAAARERNQLAQQRAERKRTLDRVAGELRAQRAEVDRLQRDEARLAHLVEQIARTLRATPPAKPPAKRSTPGERPQRDDPPQRNDAVPERGSPVQAFASLKGRLRLPVRGELAGRFGTPRQGQPGGGKGVFIAAREGEEVRAVAAGRVVFAEWMRGFGNLLILDHGDGYMSIYGNTEAVLKRLGDAVHGGEAVATVGASGGAETSGLYFEIRHQGRAFDPLTWVSAK